MTTTTAPTNKPHEMWPQMRDPVVAMAESLAFVDGWIHAYWTDEATRERYRAQAAGLIDAMYRRGWKVESR